MRVLSRTSKKNVPKAFNMLMTNSFGQGIVAYGSALVNRADAEWKSLRCSMIQCLGRARSGSSPCTSPWLSTCVCRKVTDPQLSDTLRKVKFWRSYFLHHPFDAGGLCENLQSAHVRRVGPAAIFPFALSQVGWSCEAQGRIVHKSGLIPQLASRHHQACEDGFACRLGM